MTVFLLREDIIGNFSLDIDDEAHSSPKASLLRRNLLRGQVCEHNLGPDDATGYYVR